MIETKIVEPESLAQELIDALEAAKQGRVVIVLLPEQSKLAESLSLANSWLSALQSLTKLEDTSYHAPLREAASATL